MYEYRNKLDYYNYENNNYNVPSYSIDLNPKNLYDAYNGFIRGNLFKDLYNNYKINKPYDLISKNDKDASLLLLNSLEFAAHDLNLYLDIFPDNNELIHLFNKYNMEYNRLLGEYQKKYGPILVNDSDSNIWDWEENIFPWE